VRPPASRLAVPIVAAALAACAAAGDGATPAPPVIPSGGLYQAANPWTARVDAAPLHPGSAAMMDALAAAGGFGTGELRIDFSLNVQHAGEGAPRVPFAKRAGYYEPDCDAPADFPLPPGGAAEGQAGYACDAGRGDCHVLVVDWPRNVLWEAFGASLEGGRLVARCAVAWELARSYPETLRGEQCTSADAAGLPIAPLLFTADEIAAGEVAHAIRFILPNARMRAGGYVRPATHAGAPSGGASLPPYGSRLRLRADYPLASLPSDGARVLAVALQRYGMILADGGNIAFTAADDRFTAHRWSEVGVDTRALATIDPADFEVVDPGPLVPLTYDCARSALPPL
jgi:serine/threonine-protein kinase